MKISEITGEDRARYEILEITPTCCYELWDKETESMQPCGEPGKFKAGYVPKEKYSKAKPVPRFLCKEHSAMFIRTVNK